MNNKTILIKEKKNLQEKIVLGPIKFANDFLSRFQGLMFKKDLEYILVIKTANSNVKIYSSIHTFFMRINIDVIFLNEEKKVIETAHISPWKFYNPKNKAHYILELKEGSIKKYKIKIGDKLDFVCEFI
ncbi:DUF192 domain-containing protein [Methanobrevibacter arboriphilus]